MGFVLFSNAQLYVTRRQEIIKNGNYFLLIAPEVPQRHPSRGRAPPRARYQQRRAWKRHSTSAVPGGFTITRPGGQTLVKGGRGEVTREGGAAILSCISLFIWYQAGTTYKRFYLKFNYQSIDIFEIHNKTP